METLPIKYQQAITHGCLWALGTKYDNPITVFNFFVDAILADKIARTEGYLYRLVSNYAWCLFHLRLYERSSADLNHLRGGWNVLDMIFDKLPSTFADGGCFLPFDNEGRLITLTHDGNYLSPLDEKQRPIDGGRRSAELVFPTFTVEEIFMMLYDCAIPGDTDRFIKSQRLGKIYVHMMCRYEVPRYAEFINAWNCCLEPSPDDNEPQIQATVNRDYLRLFGVVLRPSVKSHKDVYLSVILDRYLDLLRNIPLGQWELDLIISRLDAIYGQSEYLKPSISAIRDRLNGELVSRRFDELATKFPLIINCPPGFTPIQFSQLTPKARAILQYPQELQAYLLGFPIQNGIPGRNQLRQALLKLSRDGPEQYMIDVGRKYTPLIRIENDGLTWVSDDTDPISATPFAQYGPFDRLIYVDEDHAFEFLRSSWKELIKSKNDEPPKNPFNRKPFSQAFISTVKSRLKIADHYEFPDCETIQHLIETEYERVPADASPEESSRRILSDRHLSELALIMAFNRVFGNDDPPTEPESVHPN